MIYKLRVPLNYCLKRYLIRVGIRALTTECEETKETKTYPPDCCLAARTIKPRVIIIGAGIAGLSAAERLAACDIKNITILEATERPGGRIYSCWMENTITELGCCNITGSSVANSIYNLATQEGLRMIKKSSSPMLLSNDGRAIDNLLVNAVYQKYLPIQAKITKLNKKGCEDTHGSLRDFLILRIKQEIQKFPDSVRADAEKVFYGLLSCLHIYIGDDLSRVSADAFGNRIFLPGSNMVLPSGLIHVITPLLQNLPDGCLHYNKPVGVITWGTEVSEENPFRICVQCCNGEIYYADYAIITVSLGVLKEYGEKIFCPNLPDVKMEAIRKLGYGNINKIFIKYKLPFWTEGQGNFNLSWSPEDFKNSQSWLKGVNCIREVPSNNRMLSIRVAGDEACAVEGASEEEIVQGITKILRQFLGDPTIPYPMSCLVSKWRSNPFFCGSNSYISVNAHLGHQCDLANPVPEMYDEDPPILLFAGEATVPGHYGTLHGARLSGIREADRIIELTKKMNGPPPKLVVSKCKTN